MIHHRTQVGGKDAAIIPLHVHDRVYLLVEFLDHADREFHHQVSDATKGRLALRLWLQDLGDESRHDQFSRIAGDGASEKNPSLAWTIRTGEVLSSKSMGGWISRRGVPSIR